MTSEAWPDWKGEYEAEHELRVAAEERAAALTEVVRGLMDGAINELGIVREWDDLYDRGRALASAMTSATSDREDTA